MAIRVCVAGATGWAGSAVTGKILESDEFQLVGAISRKQTGIDVGEHCCNPGRGFGNTN